MSATFVMFSGRRSVVPLIRKAELPIDTLKEAMKKCGVFVFQDGKVDLRFPTMDMAREAHK
jgi:hypothetical protein